MRDEPQQDYDKLFLKNFEVAIDMSAHAAVIETREQIQSYITAKNSLLLTQEMLVEKNVDFVCGICSNIVQDPKSCPSCDLNLCRSCIETLDEKVCPECQKDITGLETSKYNKQLAKYLDRLNFMCSECDSRFVYKNHSEHLEQCYTANQSLQAPYCPLDCMASFTSEEQMEAHLE